MSFQSCFLGSHCLYIANVCYIHVNLYIIIHISIWVISEKVHLFSRLLWEEEMSGEERIFFFGTYSINYNLYLIFSKIQYFERMIYIQFNFELNWMFCECIIKLWYIIIFRVYTRFERLFRDWIRVRRRQLYKCRINMQQAIWLSRQIGRKWLHR